jgi:hypothetical protein
MAMLPFGLPRRSELHQRARGTVVVWCCVFLWRGNVRHQGIFWKRRASCHTGPVLVIKSSLGTVPVLAVCCVPSRPEYVSMFVANWVSDDKMAGRQGVRVPALCPDSLDPVEHRLFWLLDSVIDHIDTCSELN